MGSVASIHGSKTGSCNGPYGTLTKAIQTNFFAELCELEQRCVVAGLTSQETSRFLCDKYNEFCGHEDHFYFEHNRFPLLQTNHGKITNNFELIEAIIHGVDSIKKVTDDDIVGTNAIAKKSNSTVQSRFNINTVSGNTAAVSKMWREALSKPTNKCYKEISKSLCFIPNEVKVLFQGKKVFHRSCNESVVVDLRVFFHTETLSIEIVPHILEVIDTRSISNTDTMDTLGDLDYSGEYSYRLDTEDVSLHSVSMHSSPRHSCVGSPRHSCVGSPKSVASNRLGKFIEKEKRPKAEKSDFFVPLPRIYLDYYSLLATVLELSNHVEDATKSFMVAANAFTTYTQNYILNDEKRSCAVDVCMDRMVVQYITSHLQLPEEIEVVRSAKQLQTKEPQQRRVSLARMLGFSVPAIKTEPIDVPAIHEPITDASIRAKLKEYTLSFDASECSLTPVYNAPQRLEPMSVECANQLYVYCHDQTPQFF